jgi:hypothetical protein
MPLALLFKDNESNGIQGAPPSGGAGLLRTGKDRADCMRQFKAAWERFAADPINLTMFLADKRARSARWVTRR